MSAPARTQDATLARIDAILERLDVICGEAAARDGEDHPPDVQDELSASRSRCGRSSTR